MKTRLDVARVLFYASAAALIFLVGIAVATYRWFPFNLIIGGKAAVDEALIQGNRLLGIPTEFLEPARYDGEGVTRSTPDATPGLTLLTGFFDGGNELRLIRLDGTVVRRWPVQFFDIFPDSTYIENEKDVPKTNWNVSVHGSEILPDGSVVFNFQGYGTAKLDVCGNVKWVIPRFTHHAVSPATDGGFWVPSANFPDADPSRPYIRPPYVDDTVLHVAADGTILDEISVIEALYRNDLYGLIFPELSGDIIHLNDVEELTPEMAEHFPEFAAHDLLLSLRNPGLILVMEPTTLRIKWYQIGPWVHQHDPDFLEDGRIRVFSNNFDGDFDAFSRLGGSAIIDVDPVSRAISYRFRSDPEDGSPTMYTYDRGKHQTFDNGNVLVAETRSGRAFEVAPDGSIVWEYINRFDASRVAVITGAERLPETYFDVDDWTCSDRASE